MTKRFLTLAIALVLLILTGCQGNSPATNEGNGEGEGNGNESGSVYEERNADGDVVFRGEVKATDSKKYLVVYIENAVTQETYHVLISDQTVFTDAAGNSINRDAVKVGDQIEIGFSGQVMMSYPPQIAAKSIKLL